jgi:hypothetical protein
MVVRPCPGEGKRRAFSALYLRTPLWEPLERLLHTDPDPDAIALLAAASYSVIKSLLFSAQRDMAELYLRRIEQVTAGVIEHDPIAMAWVELARSSCACHIERDPWGYLEHTQASMAHYKRSGTTSFFPWGHLFLGGSYWQLGLFARAEEEFALALATATDTERINVESFRLRARLDQRRIDEASTLAAQVAREAELRGNRLHCLSSGLCLAAKIPDPVVRRSFLENIPDHRRTLELAREWLGEARAPGE